MERIYGWNGLCVEPQERQQWFLSHRGRRSKLIKAVVGAKTDARHLFKQRLLWRTVCRHPLHHTFIVIILMATSNIPDFEWIRAHFPVDKYNLEEEEGRRRREEEEEEGGGGRRRRREERFLIQLLLKKERACGDEGRHLRGGMR